MGGEPITAELPSGVRTGGLYTFAPGPGCGDTYGVVLMASTILEEQRPSVMITIRMMLMVIMRKTSIAMVGQFQEQRVKAWDFELASGGSS